MAGKKKSKTKRPLKRSKYSLALIIASVTSIGQLFFTIPTVLKYFDKVEINVSENSLSKPADENYVKTSFEIVNTGWNTAKNVELHLRILKNDKVLFVPETFTLTKDDLKGGIARNLIYRCDELVPNEKIDFFVFSSFPEYLDSNSLDTLYFDKPVRRPDLSYGPYITLLKHSLGKVKIKRPEKLTLVEEK